MSIVYFMLPLALLLGLGFAGAFVWAASQGQFDDLDSPAHRSIFPEDP